MYRECFVCGRDFGENASVTHLRIGRRIAFDVERGRLWIVCRGCGQWCLTPLEDRWEAIEECETLFRRAEARVSTANVGLARLRDVELVRIGTPQRDEIANWRYGPRFERRKRSTKITSGVLGALTETGIVGALYLAKEAVLLTGAVGVGFVLVAYGGVLIYNARGAWGWAPLIRMSLPHNERRLLLRRDLPFVELCRLQGAPWAAVRIPFSEGAVTYTKSDALHLLHRLLPHVNGAGATPVQVAAATRELDVAEERVEKSRGGKSAPRVWEHLALHKTRGPLLAMNVVDRLALEMAVAEEVERRAMAGEAGELAVRWNEEEQIARESDDMFLPRWIGDWIHAKRRPRPSPGGR